MSENILEKIVACKRKALARQKQAVPQRIVQSVLDGKLPEARFLQAISRNTRHLIGEVKKASPSAGVIREDFDGVAIAQAYERGGASAISVLTEEEFFQGSLALFDAIRAAVAVPLLRKDFIVDAYQIYESKHHGADAVLLIVGILSAARLQQFINLCHRVKLDALVEIHDREELVKALDAGARLIGLNARDLRDLSVNLEMLPSLVEHVPVECTLVCESGIKTEKDLEFVKAMIRVRALLVGEALMRAEDPEKQVHQFVWKLTR